jgi:hypothetical protein
MPTIFIANLAVPLPLRFVEGNTLGENEAAVLADIQLKRVKSRLRAMAAKGDIGPEDLQTQAFALMQLELVPYATSDDDDNDDDPIFVEALAIACELICASMAQQGLPPPRGLADHAKALVDGRPDLQEQARKRIEARYRAAADTIGDAI